MNAREIGFLLLSSKLGDPSRKTLTTPQLRGLANRVRGAVRPEQDRELELADLIALGYSQELAGRIAGLLSEQERLDYYLSLGKKRGCIPITRVSDGYPPAVRRILGDDSPGCLWAKGDLSVLKKSAVSLVGSRELRDANRKFAETVGHEAARQGFALVSGNARGADKTAQEACLAAGGQVICVVADELETKRLRENVLYLSEDGFNLPFSPQRALSRNRVIHCMGRIVLVAQCTNGKGGTWSGTTMNLRNSWTDVFCFRDESPASVQLEQLGAVLIEQDSLSDLSVLRGNYLRLI